MSMNAEATAARRAKIVEFLRSRTEPAIIQDFVSAVKEPAETIRSDLRHLVREGLVLQKRHKGICRNWGRDHAIRFCSWELAR